MSDIDFDALRIGFEAIGVAEKALEARAAAAGLEIMVRLDGFRSGRPGGGYIIAMRCDSGGRATFKKGKARATSYASAYSLTEFDALVADAVAYRKAHE